MKRKSLLIMRWACGCLSIALLLAVATNVGALAAEKIKPPLALETMGHFFAGGVVVNRTSPDPIFPGGPLFSDQKVLVNQAYVEFLIPTKLHKGQAPILLAHNSINGTIWQTTPDGREGWEDISPDEALRRTSLIRPALGAQASMISIKSTWLRGAESHR